MYGQNQYGSAQYGAIGKAGSIVVVSPIYIASNTNFGDIVGTITVQSSNIASSSSIGSLTGDVSTTDTIIVSSTIRMGTIIVDNVYTASKIPTCSGVAKPFSEKIIIVHDYNSKVLEVNN